MDTRSLYEIYWWPNKRFFITTAIFFRLINVGDLLRLRDYGDGDDRIILRSALVTFYLTPRFDKMHGVLTADEISSHI